MIETSVVRATIDESVVTLVFDLGVELAEPEDFRINGLRLITRVEAENANTLILTHNADFGYGKAYTLEYVGNRMRQVFNGCLVKKFSVDLENLAEIPEPEIPEVDIEGDVRAFIEAYGMKEAIEISNLDQPNARVPNVKRINRAIEDARRFIESYIAAANWAGKAVIRGSQSRTELIIARYYLDSKRRRRDVLEDYERALEMIDNARKIDAGPTPDEEQEGRRYNFLINRRVPRYDRRTRRGLRGWWTENTTLGGNSDNYQE